MFWLDAARSSAWKDLVRPSSCRELGCMFVFVSIQFRHFVSFRGKHLRLLLCLLHGCKLWISLEEPLLQVVKAALNFAFRLGTVAGMISLDLLIRLHFIKFN